MDNNNLKFDPMTGQPLQPQNNNMGMNNGQSSQMNMNVNSNMNMQSQMGGQTVSPINNIQGMQGAINNINVQGMDNSQGTINTVNQMQTVATVDQSKEAFIDNTQATVKENSSEKPPKVNYVFVVILFIIIFASIFFLFPYLQKNL